MNHTPGPWKVRSPNGRPSVWTEGGCKIASVEAPDCGSVLAYSGRLANSRLIAAAPDLLRCLQGAVLVVDHINDSELEGMGGHAFNLRITGEELVAIRAAIAKAEGR